MVLGKLNLTTSFLIYESLEYIFLHCLPLKPCSYGFQIFSSALLSRSVLAILGEVSELSNIVLKNLKCIVFKYPVQPTVPSLFVPESLVLRSGRSFSYAVLLSPSLSRPLLLAVLALPSTCSNVFFEAFQLPCERAQVQSLFGFEKPPVEWRYKTNFAQLRASRFPVFVLLLLWATLIIYLNCLSCYNNR